MIMLFTWKVFFLYSLVSAFMHSCPYFDICFVDECRAEVSEDLEPESQTGA